MGVSWYGCGTCGATFPDCGEYYICVGCDERLCSSCGEEHAAEFGSNQEEDDEGLENPYYNDVYCEGSPLACASCTTTRVQDYEFIEWALKKLGLTREGADKIILTGEVR